MAIHILDFELCNRLQLRLIQFSHFGFVGGSGSFGESRFLFDQHTGRRSLDLKSE